jgi:uncharacterized protein
MRPPLILLPPSKGKAPGGAGPGYGTTIDPTSPLGPARRELLDAVVAAADALDDPAVATRVCGVRSADVPEARETLARLPDAPTMAAHRRYTGIVHGNAGLADLDPAVTRADVRIVSPLMGLVGLDEPVPGYRLELVSLPGVGGLGTWWRERLAAPFTELGAGRRVWDLLPGEHARVWDPAVRAELAVVTVRFLRPDGRAANAARTKVCKGRIAAALLAAPELDPSGLVGELDPGEGWTLRAEGASVVATFAG